MFTIILISVPVSALLTPALFYRFRLGRRAAAMHRTRTLRWRMRLRLRPGAGWSNTADLVWRWSRLRAALSHGGKSRPSTTRRQRIVAPAASYAVRYGRARSWCHAYGSLEDHISVMAPPRSFKTAWLGNLIIDCPGPVVCTSTRTDLFGHTSPLRSGQGPVWVFNPQHIGAVPSTFRWDILAGCVDVHTASRRAAALLGKQYEGEGDMQFWRDKAGVFLAALLHAAALGGRSITDVWAWANRDGDHVADHLLRSDVRAARSLVPVMLEVRSSSKLADSVRGTVGPALSWVAMPELAEAATAGPGCGFDTGQFIAGNGTLYMIGAGEEGPVAPLFRTLAADIHYEAGLIGSRRPGGRLDPPFLFALDEITQICPIPLDKWAADSGGKGIILAYVVHGPSQLEGRWGRAGARTILACTGTRLILGGITDHDFLDSTSRLYGELPVKSASGEYRHERVVPAELLHQLPDRHMFVARRNCAPLTVRIRPVWKRRDVRAAGRMQRDAVIAASIRDAVQAAPAEVLMPAELPDDLDDVSRKTSPRSSDEVTS